MSLLSVLDDSSARQGGEAPAVGSAERDWAENGWPKETLLKRLEEGVKHGRGAPGWRGVGPEGLGLLLLELPSAMGGAIFVALDPSKHEAAFKSGGMSFEFEKGALAEAADALARHSHQAGERARALDPAEARKGLWQGEAARSATELASNMSQFHPKPREDWALSWERDFDRVHAAAQRQADPLEALERARAQYKGGSEREMMAWMECELRAGPESVIAGEPARRVAVGARGGEIRAALPLRADGSVNDRLPIMAVKGQMGQDGLFKQEGAAMRFYNAEAFARFASSAQSAELGAYPAPALNADAQARLGARREALAAQKPSPAPSQGARA